MEFSFQDFSANSSVSAFMPEAKPFGKYSAWDVARGAVHELQKFADTYHVLKGGPNERNAILVDNGVGVEPGMIVFYMQNGVWVTEEYKDRVHVSFATGMTRIHTINSVSSSN